MMLKHEDANPESCAQSCAQFTDENGVLELVLFINSVLADI